MKTVIDKPRHAVKARRPAFATPMPRSSVHAGDDFSRRHAAPYVAPNAARLALPTDAPTFDKDMHHG